MTATEIKKRLTEIALNGSSGRELADVMIDMLDWLQGGDPACKHDWVYSLLPQHWRCSKCTAQSHAAPTEQLSSKEEVLHEYVVKDSCTASFSYIISKMAETIPDRAATFHAGDRIKLVRERAAKPE